jgi:hypothetical protein
MKTTRVIKQAGRGRIHRMIGATLLAAAWVAVACSSGPSESEKSEGEPQSVHQFIGQSTCATAPPQATFQGDLNPQPNMSTPAMHILNPDQAAAVFNASVYNTGSNYQNPQLCWHAAVVRVENWLTSTADLVIEPPHKGPQSDASQLTQAQCEARVMTAFIYETFADGRVGRTLYQDVGATWITSGGIIPTGMCREPKLLFGGLTSVNGSVASNDGSGLTLFSPGGTYQITATYRDHNNPNAMLPMIMYTVPNKCGQAGLRCCTISHPNLGSPFCVDGDRCDGSTCSACGQSGQQACGGDSTAPNYRYCMRDFLMPDANNVCRTCGFTNAACCLGGTSPLCISGLRCADGKKCTNTPLPSMDPPPNAPTPPPMTTPPAVAGPNRCNNQGGTANTRLRAVRVQSPLTGCGSIQTYYADSDSEAAGCATNFGWTVISMSQNVSLEQYTACIYSSDFSSFEAQYSAWSPQAAQACFQSQYPSSSVQLGPCP